MITSIYKRNTVLSITGMSYKNNNSMSPIIM